MDAIWIGVAVMIGGLVGYIGGVHAGVKAVRETFATADQLSDGMISRGLKAASKKHAELHKKERKA